MRAIRYRIWEKDEKKYITCDDISITPDGRVLLRIAAAAAGCHKIIDITHNTIVEQYTGRCDVNKIDTYRNDIVTFKDETGQDKVGLVTYIGFSSCFGIDLFDGNAKRLCDVDYKKIGTIGENPGLLISLAIAEDVRSGLSTLSLKAEDV